MKTVAVVVGSLRKGSLSLKLAKAMEAAAEGRLAFRFLELGALPIYNEDLWENPPASVLELKRRVEAADAVLFVTPEYNRSMPPVVKNALDWGSRPFGKNSWAGKPGGVVGMSPGAIGAATAIAHLRSVLVTLDVVLMGQPEVYFSFKPDTLDESGRFAAEGTRDFFGNYLSRFEAWIERTAQPKADTQPDDD
jgi:chromate reductase, NAD(P)H dehydrogenase (quinone)